VGRRFVVLFHAGIVTNVGALHPENNIFCDVGGVVGHALKIAGDEQRIERLTDDLGPLIHNLDQLNEGVVFHAIDNVIHFEDGLCEFGFAFDERFESPANHGADRRAHTGDIDGKFNGGKFDHIHHAFGDVDGLIADALKVGIDFRNSEDETEIDGHRLLHGEKVEGGFVDFAFRRVDLALTFENKMAAIEVAIDVGLAGAIDSLFGESAHAEQPLAKIIEPLLKTRTHSVNLSSF
jgi:hypothetical protein